MSCNRGGGLIHICHRDGDCLVSIKRAIGRSDDNIIDIVRSSIGRSFKIRRGLERYRASGRIDYKQSSVGSSRNGITDSSSRIRIYRNRFIKNKRWRDIFHHSDVSRRNDGRPLDIIRHENSKRLRGI